MTDKYFKSLNYSLANEDTWPEVRLLRKWKPKKILSVAGSGGRSLPLLAGQPSELHVIDLSEQQLWLGSLREETIRKCTHEDFLLFWGYPPFEGIVYNRRRKEIFKGLDLSSEARNYFNQLFESVAWNTILYEGKWEKTFRKFSYVTRIIMGPKLLMESLSCLTTEEQMNFEKERFPSSRWSLVFKVTPLSSTLFFIKVTSLRRMFQNLILNITKVLFQEFSPIHSCGPISSRSFVSSERS